MPIKHQMATETLNGASLPLLVSKWRPNLILEFVSKMKKFFFFLSFCQVYFIKLTSETVIILVANLNLNSLAENSVKPCSLVLSQLLHKIIWKEYIYSYFLPIFCTWNQWLISCSRDFYLLWKYEKKTKTLLSFIIAAYTLEWPSIVLFRGSC